MLSWIAITKLIEMSTFILFAVALSLADRFIMVKRETPQRWLVNLDFKSVCGYEYSAMPSNISFLNECKWSVPKDMSAWIAFVFR